MLFEMIFLLDSYFRRSLKFFGWYGLSDTFRKTWSGGLICVFVVSSLPAIVVDGSIIFISGLFFGFLHEYGKNFSSRVAARAPKKVPKQQ